jgi:DNA-binding CsgD family transcriptional regulator
MEKKYKKLRPQKCLTEKDLINELLVIINHFSYQLAQKYFIEDDDRKYIVNDVVIYIAEQISKGKISIVHPTIDDYIFIATKNKVLAHLQKVGIDHNKRITNESFSQLTQKDGTTEDIFNILDTSEPNEDDKLELITIHLQNADKLTQDIFNYVSQGYNKPEILKILNIDDKTYMSKYQGFINKMRETYPHHTQINKHNQTKKEKEKKDMGKLINEMVKEGLSKFEICNQLGVTSNTYYYHTNPKTKERMKNRVIDNYYKSKISP